jgi:hypothetical protein
MLDHLRQRVIEVLASVQTITLSTYGPAGIQAAILPCEAAGMQLYLLLPATSDHLLNLENQPGVVVSTPTWQLRGLAVPLGRADYPPGLCLLQKAEAAWERLVLIQPAQLNIRRDCGWGYGETIDIES